MLKPRPSANVGVATHQNEQCTQTTTTASTPIVVTFHQQDPANPHQWSTLKKSVVFVSGFMSVFNSTFGSSLPAGASRYIQEAFSLTPDDQPALLVSCYLLGYIVGPPLCGPLSERYGRKPVLNAFFLLYTVFTAACAFAPSWTILLIFRFVSGVGASAPLAIVGGLYADIYDDIRQRGVAMAWFMGVTTMAPTLAPFISSLVAEKASWRWVFGTAALFAVANLPLFASMPETYAPILLRRRASLLQKQWPTARISISPSPSKQSLIQELSRPYRMLFQELIVACVSLYLSLAFAIFYLFFEAYPLIYRGQSSVYGWSDLVAGLAYLPIGVGALLCIPIFLWYDSFISRAKATGKSWADVEEYRRLPLGCAGGLLYGVSLFWLGWTSRDDVHWIVPVISGGIFGMGYCLIFMGLLNYLVDAYEVYAASATGIASTCRSILASVLPLTSRYMFSRLGISGACSLLASISLLMALIPVAFIRFGDKIRARSKICQEIKAEKNGSQRTEIEGSQML